MKTTHEEIIIHLFGRNTTILKYRGETSDINSDIFLLENFK